MNSIPITRLHELLRLDPETGRLFWRVGTSHAVKAGQEAGTKTSGGYRRVRVDGVLLLSHRIVWAMTHGVWPEGLLDHANTQRDDNRGGNLREATKAENRRNSGPMRTNKSGRKGVCWKARAGKWVAQICVDYKVIGLGYFTDIELAAQAYEAAARQMHGEFSRVVAK